MDMVSPDMWIKEEITPADAYWHGVTRVLAYKRTEYQDMYLVESPSYGKALVLDGLWQISQADEFIYQEGLAQPALIAHGNPRKVLILGGGDGAVLREVLRWNTVERVVMVDIDGPVVEACKELLPEIHQGSFDDPRAEVIIGDALKYVAETQEKWDVVISDLTDPTESGPSFPLFCREFFADVRKVMAPGAVYVAQAGPVSPLEVTLHARVVNTLASVFKSVTSYAAPTPTYGRSWGFALCSDQELNLMPNPAEVDELLASKTKGGLRLVDGQALLGMLQGFAYIRRAIAAETTVYTQNDRARYDHRG